MGSSIIFILELKITIKLSSTRTTSKSSLPISFYESGLTLIETKIFDSSSFYILRKKKIKKKKKN